MTEQVASTGLYERAEHAARVIRSRTQEAPRVALVLGSGLGGFADDFEEPVRIPYEDIPGFARSTAEGHAGQLVIGKVDEVPLVAMQGRVHFYEGYSLEQVTFPIRTFKLLGVKTVILTNAAGGVNVQLSQGALMVLSDHLNLMGDNPLRGPNDERFGPGRRLKPFRVHRRKRAHEARKEPVRKAHEKGPGLRPRADPDAADDNLA